MTEPRIVHCKKLGKDLPGLAKAPYKNDLGKRIYEEISKEAWDMWVKDSVKYMNTYRLDVTESAGLKFMLKQCAIYFGFEEGDLAQTAFVPTSGGGSSDPHAGHDHAPGEGHDHDHAGHDHAGHDHDKKAGG